MNSIIIKDRKAKEESEFRKLLTYIEPIEATLPPVERDTELFIVLCVESSKM